MIKTILLLSILYLCSTKPIDPSKVSFAVNCGTESSMKSSSGFIFKKDTGYSQESKVSDYFLNPELAKIPVKYTYDEAIYKTERHSDSSFHYEIPVKGDGIYTLILKFCEMYFTIPNQRVFNIKFGEHRVLEGVDVVSKVGPYAAYDEYIEFEVKDGKLIHNGVQCNQAYFPNTKTVKVIFEKTHLDLPKVEAIVLFDGPLAETDFFDQEAFRKEWDNRVLEENRIIEELRKKKVENKRKVLEALQEDDEYFNSQETTLQGIQRVLIGKEGAVILGLLASCFILLAILVNESELKEFERKKSL